MKTGQDYMESGTSTRNAAGTKSGNLKSNNGKRALDSDFEIYEQELKRNIEQLREFDRHIIFSNTTPNPKNAGMRNDLDVVILNEIAERVMKEYDVPHNDLYSLVKSQPNYPTLYMHPRAENNCHFLDHGRKLLGENVGKFVVDNFVGND